MNDLRSSPLLLGLRLCILLLCILFGCYFTGSLRRILFGCYFTGSLRRRRRQQWLFLYSSSSSSSSHSSSHYSRSRSRFLRLNGGSINGVNGGVNDGKIRWGLLTSVQTMPFCNLVTPFIYLTRVNECTNFR